MAYCCMIAVLGHVPHAKTAPIPQRRKPVIMSRCASPLSAPQSPHPCWFPRHKSSRPFAYGGIVPWEGYHGQVFISFRTLS